MSDDPLAQYRRKSPPSGQEASPVEAGYEAFKAVDKRQFRLQVRPANRAYERLPYAYLLRIVEDGTFGTQVCLVYTFMVVVILGRNLLGLGDAIGDEKVEFIAEFDPDRHGKPTDPKAPIVESITISEKGSQQEAMSEAKGDTRH